jgi:hypothetical protein
VPESALPGDVGRCARLRRHGHHPAAVIAPLYGGRSAMPVAADRSPSSPRQTPTTSSRSYWNSQHNGADFEAWWRSRPRRSRGRIRRCRQKTVAVRGDALRARAESDWRQSSK